MHRDIRNGVVGLAIAAAVAVSSIGGCMTYYPEYKVYTARMEGAATQARADGAKQALVAQATAERDAAQLRAEAIGIMGEAAKRYPEYRQQEFVGAFGEALREGKINQIIYVPTEGNIPILEAGRVAK